MEWKNELLENAKKSDFFIRTEKTNQLVDEVFKQFRDFSEPFREINPSFVKVDREKGEMVLGLKTLKVSVGLAGDIIFKTINSKNN